MRTRVSALGPARTPHDAARDAPRTVDSEGFFLRIDHFPLALSTARFLIFPLSKTARGRKRPRVVSSLSAVHFPLPGVHFRYPLSFFACNARCARRATQSATARGAVRWVRWVIEVGEVGE